MIRWYHPVYTPISVIRYTSPVFWYSAEYQNRWSRKEVTKQPVHAIDMQESARFKDVVERIGRGDEAAFQELYDAVSGRVFSYIVPRTASREEALDIMQEVFIGIWAARLRFTYRNDASVYGFVFTIARRVLAAHYGRAKRDAAIAEMPQDDRYDMDIESLGDVHMIERALTELSDDDRDVLTLRYWSGFSFDEIAQAQDKKETAVRVRHHRALGKLRTILSSYGS